MNDTLDFAKIEQGLLQLCCEPFSGAAFLSELASTWARPAAEVGVAFSVAPAQPADDALLRARALCGDLLRLQQITNKCARTVVQKASHTHTHAPSPLSPFRAASFPTRSNSRPEAAS
jgi:hypothetical protein